MSGPRPDGSQGMPPSSWRNRGGSSGPGGPAPSMQSQNDAQSRRGNNPIPPWQQQGQTRGPPPSSNFGPPPSNSGFGPPQNTRMDHPPPNNSQNPRAPVSYPTNRWSAPNSFNDNQMPPSAFGNIPPHWANQPPPPPPPE